MKTSQKQKTKNIPNGWEIKKMGLITDIVSGGTPSTTELVFWNGEIDWITPSEIIRSGKYFLNDQNTEKKITEEGLRKSSAKLIPSNSLILCSRATLAECLINKKPISTNQGFKNLIPKKDIDINFLYYWTKVNKKEYYRISQGSTFLEFSKKDLEKVELILPPLPEQNRIVFVLETWDEVLEKLKKKISLKKEIKKGLMQELLTGKKRLPGFSSEWKEVKLGDIADIKTGKKDNKDKETDGDFPFFVRSPQVERINSYSFDGEAILIPGEGNIGKIFHYINGKFDYHQRVYKISDFSGANGKYIYYHLVQNFVRQAKKHSVKATVDSLRLPTFKLYPIFLPDTQEQKAIAKILTTTDDEIITLEKKLNLWQEQKKYLLNNLVTGQIRTPENLLEIINHR